MILSWLVKKNKNLCNSYFYWTKVDSRRLEFDVLIDWNASSKDIRHGDIDL